MTDKVDLALYEIYGERGLTLKQIEELLDTIAPSPTGYTPLEINAKEHESVALGFATCALDRACDFDIPNSYVGRKVQSILDDMNLETYDGRYIISIGDTDYTVSLTRP